MLALAACCNNITPLQAQESHKKFTLTDGRLWWMDANSCDLDRIYTVAFDSTNSWAKVHIYGLTVFIGILVAFLCAIGAGK